MRRSQIFSFIHAIKCTFTHPLTYSQNALLLLSTLSLRPHVGIRTFNLAVCLVATEGVLCWYDSEGGCGISFSGAHRRPHPDTHRVAAKIGRKKMTEWGGGW